MSAPTSFEPLTLLSALAPLTSHTLRENLGLPRPKNRHFG